MNIHIYLLMELWYLSRHRIEYNCFICFIPLLKPRNMINWWSIYQLFMLCIYIDIQTKKQLQVYSKNIFNTNLILSYDFYLRSCWKKITKCIYPFQFVSILTLYYGNIVTILLLNIGISNNRRQIATNSLESIKWGYIADT